MHGGPCWRAGGELSQTHCYCNKGAIHLSRATFEFAMCVYGGDDSGACGDGSAGAGAVGSAGAGAVDSVGANVNAVHSGGVLVLVLLIVLVLMVMLLMVVCWCWCW